MTSSQGELYVTLTTDAVMPSVGPLSGFQAYYIANGTCRCVPSVYAVPVVFVSVRLNAVCLYRSHVRKLRQERLLRPRFQAVRVLLGRNWHQVQCHRVHRQRHRARAR